MKPERIAELREIGPWEWPKSMSWNDITDLLATAEREAILRTLAEDAEQVIDDLDTRFEHAELRHCIRAALSTKGTE